MLDLILRGVLHLLCMAAVNSLLLACVPYIKHMMLYRHSQPSLSRAVAPAQCYLRLAMGNGNFRPPTESTPLNQSPKNLSRMITSATLQLCQIWCTSVLGGLLSEWVKYNLFLTYFLFICTLFSRTHIQVRRVDGFSHTCMMVQTTLTRARMCLFGFR